MTNQQMELLDYLYGKEVTFDDIRKFLGLSEEEFEKQRPYILNKDVFMCLRQLPFKPAGLNLLQRPVRLSTYGEEIVERAREDRKSNRVKELRGWITTVIAFLALILSILSLIWQTYTWKIERSEKSQSPESKSTVIATTEADSRTSNEKCVA